MEDIYTIKVKTRPDPGGLYPSERRYSASNVSGLAWVHLALAVLSFLLACLALVNPIDGGDILELKNLHNNKKSVLNDIDNQNGSTMLNTSHFEIPMAKSSEYGFILITAPSLLTIAALISGMASILASKQWYIDRNIKWLFATSVFSTILSLISFCMIAVWIGIMSEGSFHFTNFYKDLPYDTMPSSLDSTNTIVENSSLYYIVKVPLGQINYDNYTNDDIIGTLKHSHNVTKRVLSINILIAAFLEFVWSCLSVRISWRGMRTNYSDDDDSGRRGGNCLKVVTTLKGNNTRRLPRNTKIIPPKPNILGQYPRNGRVKRLFLAQQDLRINGNSHNIGNPKLNGLSQSSKENSAEYRERMYDFINKCPSSFEDMESNPGGNISSVISETSNTNARTVSPIYEEPAIREEKENELLPQHKTNSIGRLSCMSWGDPHDQTIYNQNTIDLDTIIGEKRKGLSANKIETESDNFEISLKMTQDIEEKELRNDEIVSSEVNEKSRSDDAIITTDDLNVRVSEQQDVTIKDSEFMTKSPKHIDGATDRSKSEKSVEENVDS